MDPTPDDRLEPDGRQYSIINSAIGLIYKMVKFPGRGRGVYVVDIDLPNQTCKVGYARAEHVTLARLMKREICEADAAALVEAVFAYTVFDNIAIMTMEKRRDGTVQVCFTLYRRP